MVLGRKRKKKAEEVAEPTPPAEWEGEVEDDEDMSSNETDDELDAAKKRLALLEKEVALKRSQVAETPTGKQARIRAATKRDDGFYEWVVESNYVIGGVGDYI